MSDTDFPTDLLGLQRHWYAVEAAWAADPTEENRFALAKVGAELHARTHWPRPATGTRPS
ncbi:hypothetical protein [Kitasatospora sp. NPDC015120]|uniref:hypothetical protein n=1 Tax=Kitasatospora sp. NPDC015120 TaxID=3364023 RepID=UPI0036F49B41